MKIYDVTVNYLKNPTLDSRPFFSWKLKSDKRGIKQTAYRIVMSKDPSFNEVIWDTQWTQGDRLTYHPCNHNLSYLTRYHFQIHVQTNDGQEISSQIEWFETGKLDEEWDGRWISGHFCKKKDQVMGGVYLRKAFQLDKPIEKANLYICGLGYFEARINGQKVGNDFLSTPYTAFDQQVQYRSFEVTDMLQQNANALGVILGNGFYNSFTEDPWQTSTAPWRDMPKLIVELHITHTDGSKTLLLSDGSWRSSKGPITFNGIRHGEYYDARLQQDHWDEGFFDDANWQEVLLVRAPGGTLRSMEMEPIRIRKKYRPIKKHATKNGWLLDIGQAQSGIANITFHGKKGDVITVRYSDLITEDGELDQSSLSVFIKNHLFQTDQYTKRSDQPETWHTTFAYHGFQYMEISGNDWEPDLTDIEVWSLCNDFSDRGHFSCSDPVVNQIQSLCAHSNTSMCFSVMASDTVREKSSWTGDTGLSCEQMLFNYGCEAFFRKWMQDLRDAQRPEGTLPCIVPSPGWGYNSLNGPDWCNPIHEVPNQLLVVSGDLEALKDNYEALCKYINYLGSMANDHILSYGLGDWCPPFEGPAISENMASFKCPVPVSDTAYYHSALLFAQKAAHLLQNHCDEQAFAEKAYSVKKAFREKFFDPKTHMVKGNCQTATAMMIFHQLANEEEIPQLIHRLIQQIQKENGHLDYGILGMKAVLNSLGTNGHAQLALDMVTAPEYPSIRHWIDLGATTLWECWNGGGSHNHHMFSDISAFLYKYIGGVLPDPEKTGFEKIIFKPHLAGSMEWAKTKINSVAGWIRCHWEKTPKTFQVTVEIPPGARAQLILPVQYDDESVLDNLTESKQWIMDHPDIHTLSIEKEQIMVSLDSGTYHFALAHKRV